MLFNKTNYCVEKLAFFKSGINIKIFDISRHSKIFLQSEDGFLEICLLNRQVQPQKINPNDIIGKYSPLLVSSVPALYIFKISQEALLFVYITDRIDSVMIEKMIDDDMLKNIADSMCDLLKVKELDDCLNFFMRKIENQNNSAMKKISQLSSVLD